MGRQLEWRERGIAVHSRCQIWGAHHCWTAVRAPTPRMVCEADERMEEMEYKVSTSGSESLSQVPAGWEQVWEGIPKACSLSGAPRGFVVSVRDPNSAVRDMLAVRPCPMP